MLSILDPRLWLAFLLALALSFGAGYAKRGRIDRVTHAAEIAAQAAQARDTEQELQRLSNQATSAFIDRLQKQQERAHALPKIVLPHDCSVPADVGRVLNDAQRMLDDAGSGPGAGAAGAAVDSTCAAELEIAKRNYAEVCLPNAEQLTALQQRWNETRDLLNRGRE